MKRNYDIVERSLLTLIEASLWDLNWNGFKLGERSLWWMKGVFKKHESLFFSCPVFSDQRSKNKVVLYAQGWIEGWPNLKEKWRLSMARIFYKHKWCSKRKLNNRNYSFTSISASFNISNAWTTVRSLTDQNQIWSHLSIVGF